MSRRCSGSWLGALALALSMPAGAQEFRALWVDAWGAGFRTPAEVTQLISDARAAHLNALVIQVRRRGDCFYTGSPYEPKTADSTVPADFDPLADVIAKAHSTSHGPRLEVHAWIVTYNIWNQQTNPPSQPDHPYNLHPDWLTRSDSGATWDGSNYAFDPAHPEVQRHTFNVALDLITRYDIDGLNFDYIRYNGPSWGYNPVAVARFNARHGLAGQPPAGDAWWKQFRRDQVTALLRKVYLSALALRPQVKISADTITWHPGPASEAQWYSSARAWTDVLQDWRGWMEEGILDLNIPMTYFDQAGGYTLAWTNWNQFAKDHRFQRHVAMGPGIYLNSVSNAIVQMRFARTASPAGHAPDGVCGYSYRVTNKDGVARSALLNALVSPGGYDPVTPPMFSELATPPPMPWKAAPTRGHLKGVVAAGAATHVLDGAAVSIEGPTGRAALTDATGFYGFVDLTPGLYAITATAPGLGRLASNVVITAGVVSTVDLRLATNHTVNDILMDNLQATGTGGWSTGTASTDKFGEDYRYNGPGQGDEYLQFTPHILVAGDYAVDEWHPAGGNRTTNAPHVIAYRGGVQTVFVNQEVDGGQWNRLGVFPFDAGTSSWVRITDAFPEPANNVVLADAIRFTHVPRPPTIVDPPRSLVVNAGESFTFSVSAAGFPPPAFQWRFNGQDIPGATGSLLSRGHARLSDAGDYSVALSNVAGTNVSPGATLQVMPPPQPHLESALLRPGDRIKLLITARPGCVWAVEGSSNLVNWVSLGTLTNLSSPFAVTNVIRQAVEFYRVTAR